LRARPRLVAYGRLHPLAAHRATFSLPPATAASARTPNARLAAHFAKWRAVIAVDRPQGHPDGFLIKANVQALAGFAALSQEAYLAAIAKQEALIFGAFIRFLEGDKHPEDVSEDRI
jgi:fructose-bisphosphate aldolase class 1